MTHNYLHAGSKAADRNNLFSAGSFLTHTTIRRGFACGREDPPGPEAVSGLGQGKETSPSSWKGLWDRVGHDSGLKWRAINNNVLTWG